MLEWREEGDGDMGVASASWVVVLFGVLAVEVDARDDVIFEDAGEAETGWVGL